MSSNKHKKGMGLINGKTNNIRNPPRCLQRFLKLNNVFIYKLDFQIVLPNNDVKTRWPSTSTMIRKSYAARRVPSAVIAKHDDLADLLVCESEVN